MRIHEGPEAVASARAVGASVYTSGPHIVVGDDYADIESPSARRTLAHELYHVKQQSEGPVPGTATDDGLAISDPSDPYEGAAQRAVEHIAGSPGSSALPGNLRAEVRHARTGTVRGFPAIPVQRETSTADIEAQGDVNIDSVTLSGTFNNCQIAVSGAAAHQLFHQLTLRPEASPLGLRVSRKSGQCGVA